MSTSIAPAPLLTLPVELVLKISSHLDDTMDYPSKLALAQASSTLTAIVPVKAPERDGEKLLFLFMKEQRAKYVLSLLYNVIFTYSLEKLQTQEWFGVSGVSQVETLVKFPDLPPWKDKGGVKMHTRYCIECGMAGFWADRQLVSILG